MLDPSSSEDTGGESDTGVVEEPPRKQVPSRGGGSKKRPPAAPGGSPGKGEKVRDATGEEEKRKERERIQKEEERKRKLQIYVFVLRCIAYPFNAKQPTDMARRQQKVSLCCTPKQHTVHLSSATEALLPKCHKKCQLEEGHLFCLKIQHNNTIHF